MRRLAGTDRRLGDSSVLASPLPPCETAERDLERTSRSRRSVALAAGSTPRVGEHHGAPSTRRSVIRELCLWGRSFFGRSPPVTRQSRHGGMAIASSPQIGRAHV